MAINGGPNLNSVPAAQKQALSTNYLDLANSSNAGWSQQYLPDLMEKEAEVFGPRTISGFLAQVGAEEAMTADQVVWSEQGRLHLSYKAKITSSDTILLQSDIDESNYVQAGLDIDHGVRVADTIIVSNAAGVFKCRVTSIANNDALTVARYDAQTLAAANTDKSTTVLVYGSEYAKGTAYTNADNSSKLAERHQANEPDFKTFKNKPIIMKDYYEISGSDTSKIGWVEVSTEGGQGGYLWYLKAESDTRARFNDYVEMSMLESVRGGINAAAGAGAIRGVMIPAGTSSVYDQTVGASMKRPFLHVRYRASQTDDRRMKTWTTGSVGAATSALDAMSIHMLTERCLITQGANNFMLMK